MYLGVRKWSADHENLAGRGIAAGRTKRRQRAARCMCSLLPVAALRLTRDRDCKLLDTPSERRFDSITSLLKDMLQVGWRGACRGAEPGLLGTLRTRPFPHSMRPATRKPFRDHPAVQVPIVVVSLIDDDRLWFKSVAGVSAGRPTACTRSATFPCARTAPQRQSCQVGDQSSSACTVQGSIVAARLCWRPPSHHTTPTPLPSEARASYRLLVQLCRRCSRRHAAGRSIPAQPVCGGAAPRTLLRWVPAGERGVSPAAAGLASGVQPCWRLGQVAVVLGLGHVAFQTQPAIWGGHVEP